MRLSVTLCLVPALTAVVIAAGTFLSSWPAVGTAAGQERLREGDPKDKIDQPAWGKPVKGLRLGLCPTEPKGAAKARVTLVLENVGKKDFVLLLGDSFGLGKKHWLESIRLHVTDVDGRKRVLIPNRPELNDRDGALITAFAVQLVADGRYTISRDLNEFFDENDVEKKLPPGRYRVTAEFVGKAVPKPKNKEVVAGYAHLVDMHFWEGTIKSDECQITLPAPPPK
jgi:hypothetical protein